MNRSTDKYKRVAYHQKLTSISSTRSPNVSALLRNQTQDHLNVLDASLKDISDIAVTAAIAATTIVVDALTN